jgi:hypothetical protein
VTPLVVGDKQEQDWLCRVRNRRKEYFLLSVAVAVAVAVSCMWLFVCQGGFCIAKGRDGKRQIGDVTRWETNDQQKRWEKD